MSPCQGDDHAAQSQAPKTWLAAAGGLAPPFADSKSAVLRLDDTATKSGPEGGTRTPVSSLPKRVCWLLHYNRMDGAARRRKVNRPEASGPGPVLFSILADRLARAVVA